MTAPQHFTCLQPARTQVSHARRHLARRQHHLTWDASRWHALVTPDLPDTSPLADYPALEVRVASAPECTITFGAAGHLRIVPTSLYEYATHVAVDTPAPLVDTTRHPGWTDWPTDAQVADLLAALLDVRPTPTATATLAAALAPPGRPATHRATHRVVAPA